MRAVVGRTLRVVTAGAALSLGAARSLDDAQHCEDACQRHMRATTFEYNEDGDKPASAIREHGSALLLHVLSTDLKFPTEVEASAVAAAAGAAVAAMLPTVHQADAWVRQSMGSQFGERAVAAAIAQQEPTLLGCLQAVGPLQPYASRRWPAGDAPPGMRALDLHEAATPAALDALDEAIDRASAAVDSVLDSGGSTGMQEVDGSPLVGSVSPTATRLRGWAAVLLAPASRWTGLVDSCRLDAYSPARVRLLVPPVGELEGGTIEEPTPAVPADDLWHRVRRASGWARHGPRDGLVVLLPLPNLPTSGSAGVGVAGAALGMGDVGDGGAEAELAGLRVDVMLPLGEALAYRLPVRRVTVPAGGALALAGGTRWQLADDSPCACALFEYQPTSGAGGAAPASAFELAGDRVADAASVAVRAAWALVVLRGEDW